MPDNPNPRTVHEAAAEHGLTIEDYRKTSLYEDAVRDGLVEDPRRTGPNVDAGLEPGDVTADPTISSVAGADYNPGVNTVASASAENKPGSKSRPVEKESAEK